MITIIIKIKVAHDTNIVYEIMRIKTLALLAILFVGLSFVSCSSDDNDENSKPPTNSLMPFIGYWQNLNEDEEYHSILTITENRNYQIRYQDGEDIGTNGGMVSFDKKSNTMTFSPTFNNGTDTQEAEYKYTILDVSDSRLQVIDEDGNNITYEKISDGTFTPRDDWGKSLVGGTWDIYKKSVSGEILWAHRYTFFEGGTYSCWSWNEHFVIYENGIFMFDNNTITIGGKQGYIINFTSNSIKFSMDDEIYSGTRIVEKDKKLVESNKKLLIGTWSCVVGTYYGDEKSVLTLKPNGEYENEYLDEYGNIYKGNYYISEDKIFFEEPTEKDPIGGERQIKELTTEGFVLTNFYDEKYIIGTKTK